MRIATRDNKKANPLRLLGLKISEIPMNRNITFFDNFFSPFLNSLYPEINKDIEDTKPIKMRITPAISHMKNLSSFLLIMSILVNSILNEILSKFLMGC